MSLHQNPKDTADVKQEAKTDITYVPAHLLAELYTFLDKDDPVTALSALALLNKNFAASVRETNLINLIDLIDLLRTDYQVTENELPISSDSPQDITKLYQHLFPKEEKLPDIPKATFKIYCHLLLHYQDKFKSTIRDYMDQGANIHAYLTAPDITRQVKHLQNAITNKITGFQANRIFLKSLKRFQESSIFKELTPESVLVKAITTGHLDAMLTLLERKADINARDKEGNTPVMLAVKQNNLELIRLLILRKADVSLTNTSGDTALMLAIKAENAASVQMLAETKGTDINTQNTKQQSALTLAVKNRQGNLVNLLLSYKADPKVISEGWSLLGLAVQNNDSPMAHTLLDLGLDPSSTIPDSFGTTLVMQASSQGNVSLLELLMDYKADIFAKDKNGYNALMTANNEFVARALLEKGMLDVINDKAANGSTALIQAINKNNVPLFNILLTNGADPNAAYNDGTTAVMRAIYFHEFILSSLLEFAADINALDKQGRTALMRYADQSDHFAKRSRIQLLLECKSNPNVADEKGLTSLMLLCKYPIEDIKIPKLLIDAKANLDAKDRQGLTPFMHLVLYSKHYTLSGDKYGHYSPGCLKLFAREDEIETALKIAVRDNNLVVTQHLLTHFKLDINSFFKSDAQVNPLLLATLSGHVEMVKLLLEQKADPNAVNLSNLSALIIAVAPKVNKDPGLFVGIQKDKSIAITKMLLESKANVNMATVKGSTPLLSAALNGYVESVQLLLACQADISTRRPDGLTALEIAQKRVEASKNIMTDKKAAEIYENKFEARSADQLVAFLEDFSKKSSAEQESTLHPFKKL